ncbi:MAG: DUF4834 family protein [Prevotella sp.]|nr:DUF4834 family protein [Prevotella sp.]
MFLLKFILLIFIAIFIVLIYTAYNFFNQVRNATKRFREQQPSQQTKVNGNAIIDHRSPEETQKKIIPDDEGEYIDFEE